MTFPIWFALPPEVHSTLLSTGPGPSALWSAAAAWRALATQYTDISDELTQLLAAVRAGSWDGPTAERFVAAHQPFLDWLAQAAAVANAAATAHESAAAGYTSALAAMPTLAELATNHAVHGALVATNFFGINTIPIAFNESDYMRMWVQAAITMTGYQAVSQHSVTATPRTSPAPQIMTADAAPAATSSMPDPVKIILQALQGFLNFLRNLAAETLSGPLEKFVVHVLDSFISFASGSVFKFVAYAVLDPMIYFGPFTPAISPLGLPAVTVGLAGLAGISTPPQTAPPLPDVAQSAPPNHQISPATTGVAVAGVSSGATVAGSTPTAHAAAAPSGPSSAGPVAAQSFYAVLGPDGGGHTPTTNGKALAGATADAVAPAARLPGDQARAASRRARTAQNAYASTAMNSLTPTDTRPQWTHQQRSQAPSANTARMRLNFPEKSPKQLLDNRIGSPRAGKPDSPKPQRYPCCHAPGPTPTPARH
ncbi:MULTISPECIES: PPE family protein [Mycobacterium]|uniref:PPE family protein PPE37 n=1 Tax=Mycobacterium pseudoshottsii TaxID=265949 RepID=A0A9N7QLE0_9MYCO|nr:MULTISPECIES: PPE family protein [Mycobacterium]EPQ47284.1 PPE family protein [Mycobacterium sp. 012931]MBC9865170.1 PPE family protein [Mycobacterium pseudoshottsii]BBA88678.1 putative PPE family protein PPE37 [Mycobacterium pseudoshottsii JCM 15466]BDN82943.1 putative PPE family protein PPE37 [Mycobacterium pseudoshottsii]BEH77329.1 putative PPE family protein PPE37 [Mycobacterium pseudoshottsii]